MRCDQMIGLPSEAIVFLKQNKLPVNVCTHCHQILLYSRPNEKDIISFCGGMFGDEYPLYRYHLKDGNIATEYLQAAPWSSGPCFFVGLRVTDESGLGTHDFKWSEEEIENC